jgi:hypothetical protein
MEHQLDATITSLLISKISSTCFGQAFAHLQERKTEIFTTYGILSCWCGSQGFWTLLLNTSAQKPCLPHQQDSIPYVVKISVLRSWRWAKVCPKHVELILEINKTVIVASSWCFILHYLHWWCTVKHKSSLLSSYYDFPHTILCEMQYTVSLFKEF